MEPLEPFKDRHEAGRALATALGRFSGSTAAVVLALPRGGVPVAYEVAKALGLPLDIMLVRKLGVPGHEELAFGAVASGGIKFVNHSLVRSLRMTDAMVEKCVQKELRELERRERAYRGDKSPLNISDKTVILVDDGLATGATMLAAVQAAKQQKPKQIVIAVPVASADTCREFADLVDVRCVCFITPEPFYAVGLWYEDFSQTSDDEVRSLLAEAERESHKQAPAAAGRSR